MTLIQLYHNDMIPSGHHHTHNNNKNRVNRLASSNHNLYHGLGKIEELKDVSEIKNQILPCIGQIVYNICNLNLGGFLQDIDSNCLILYSSKEENSFSKYF